MLYICAYYGNQCREFCFSQGGTWDGTLTFPQESSGLNHDIVVPIRSLEGKWFLTAPEGLKWKEGAGREIEISNGQTIRISVQRVAITIMVFEMENNAMMMSKYALPLGVPVRIGRNESSTICQNSNIMTAMHGELTAVSDKECYYTDHSKNGTYINDNKVLNQRVRLAYGDLITVGFGLKIGYLGGILAVNQPPALVHNQLKKAVWDGEKTFDVKKAIQEDQTSPVTWYHRAPRIWQDPNQDEVTIEPPLAKETNNMPPAWMTIGPSATMVVPMLLSAMVGGRSNIAPMMAMMGGSAAMAVMWGIINSNYRKKHGAEIEEKRVQVYQNYLVETENKLLSLTERELARQNLQNQTIAQCLTLPRSNTHRLWERMPQHPDFTLLRLGTGQVALPNPINIQEEKLSLEPDPLASEPKRLKDMFENMNGAPITVQLKEWNIIGILGSVEHPYVMQSMVAQLAATHSYHDVVVSILARQEHQSQWDWVRWLPHAFDNEDHDMRLTAFTPAAVQAVEEHLSDVLMIRDARMGERAGDAEEKAAIQPLPHYVIFCTDPALVENQPFLRRMLGRRLGFTLVLLAESMEQLPKECGLIISANERMGSLYTAQGGSTNVQYETTDLKSLQRFSKEMAVLRVKDATESSFIPSLVTFLEIYHARAVEDIDIWRMWNENHAYEGLRSVIGLRSGSQPFILDISEKYHGPHGLVAGTTGSGKSVMLQTYILSLALNYHPEEVQFILIDYKGGGMANVFTDLPHVAGIIDNLQGKRTISRALMSIQGEIKRREEIFKRLGVEKIDEYIRYYNHDPQEIPLAHIIIVVDEFAELKKEQPEFMRELVSTARVGRSVGIHMILATQKPSNSVDDEIWSNTNFRICLRVATRADSNEMLKRPDAAYLKGMGRCYVQVGNDEIFEQVQTSYSGAEYAPTALVGDEVPRMLDDVGRPMVYRKKSHNDSKMKPKTQMDVVLERIHQVMGEHQVHPARPLWMREIEQVIRLETLPEFAERRFANGAWNGENSLAETFRVYYGMVDDVRMQRHLPLSVDFYQDHNLKILAPAGAGKTTLIQTLAMSAAMTYTPEQVQMYIFSLTSRTLGVLADLPHVGEVVYENEDAEIIQLLNLLIEEDRRRTMLFAEHLTDSFVQYNIAAESKGNQAGKLPAILVFVDRMKQLLEKLNEEQTRQWSDLVRNAASRGIYFIISAIAQNAEETARLAGYFTGIAIQQEDRSAYREVLGATGAITADEADVRAFPGRGLVWFDNGVHGAAACEMQCAVFHSAVDTERMAQLEQSVQEMNEAWKGTRPRGIVRIPSELTMDTFRNLLSRMNYQHRVGKLVLAIGKSNGRPCVIDLDRTPSFLIVGGLRNGKTNAALAAADQLRRDGGTVHLFGEDRALKRYADQFAECVTFHGLGDDKVLQSFFEEELAPIMVERKGLVGAVENKSEQERQAVTEKLSPIALIFDDYDAFIKAMALQTTTMQWLPKMNRVMAGRRLYFILTLSHRAVSRSMTNELVQDLARSGVGLALGGQLSEADPWNAGTVATRRLKLPVGEGLFIQNGEVIPAVIPDMSR